MSDDIVHVEGVLRVCCADPANLVVERQSSDLVVKTCRECGRHHYEMGVDAGALGVEGVGL